MKKRFLAIFLAVVMAATLLPVTALAYYNMDENGVVTFHDGVTRIPFQTFMNNPLCPDVTRVIIPDSVTYIDWGVFTNCPNLTSVTIPSSVAEFYGSDTFSGCPGLKTAGPIGSGCDIEFGWTEKIPDYAFRDCALTSVTIPESVTDIGVNAFGTLWLKDMGDFPVINGILVKYQGPDSDVVIPKGVTRIGPGAFKNCTGLTSVTIPDSVTSIGRKAFSGCKGLTSITIPDSVTRIEEQAFMGCSGLTDVTIGSGVTSIEVAAFRDCTGLTSITIPDSVTSIIGDYAFYGCPNLTVYGGAFSEAERYCKEHNIRFVYTDHKFRIDENGVLQEYRGPGGDVAVPDGVVGVGAGAFAYRKDLTSVTIPESVTAIDPMAFDATFWLNAIHVAEGNLVYSSQDGVLFNKDKTELVAYVGGQYQQYVIPDSVTVIGERAFEDCDLAGVVIPDSVTSIGDYAFFNCYSLASILIPDSVASIGAEAFSENNSMTVYGHEGCYAQQYCAGNNIHFERIRRYPDSAEEMRTITDEDWGVSITFDGCLREDTHVYLSTDGDEYYRGELTFYVLREGSTVRIEALPGREYGAPFDYYEASEEEQKKYVWASTGFGMGWSDEDRLFVGYYSSEPVGLRGPITEIALPVEKRQGGYFELINQNKHYGMYLCESDFNHLVPALTREMFTVDTAEEAYTGLAVTKAITGRDGDKVLTEGVDYTVTYTDNVDLGPATMTITGRGDYNDVLEYTFDIVEVVHTGSLEGDERSLDWSCSGTGRVTVSGEIGENEMVLVACYDDQGKLTELKRLTRDEMTAQMQAGGDTIKLFWLGANQNPLSPSATVWGK